MASSASVVPSFEVSSANDEGDDTDDRSNLLRRKGGPGDDDDDDGSVNDNALAPVTLVGILRSSVSWYALAAMAVAALAPLQAVLMDRRSMSSSSSSSSWNEFKSQTTT